MDLTYEQLRNMSAPAAARRYDYLENTFGRQAADDFEVRWAAANYGDDENPEDWGGGLRDVDRRGIER